MTTATIATLEAALRLVRLAMKPGASLRDRLTITRLVLRRVHAYREAIHDERHALRRQARLLRERGPFAQRRAKELEQQADSHGAEDLDLSRPVLLAFGEALLNDCNGYMAALGFDAMCDLLSVNRVEREQARADGVADLAGLVFVHNLEDSASHRGEDWKRGPLFDACLSAMAEFMRRTPRHLRPDPFAPGGPLYGVPVMELHPDGSMTTKRPALVVHDRNGSRVVER